MNQNQFNTAMQGWMDTQRKKEIVFVDNGRVVTDSLTVAEVFGKTHDKVLRDIRELGCSEDFRLSNFGESVYVNGQGREMPKYLITEQGFTMLAMGYTGQRAMEFKERYISEFDRMRQQLQSGVNIGQLSPQLQFMIQLEQRTTGVENEVTALKQVIDSEVWITEAQRGQIRDAVNIRMSQLKRNGYANAHFQGIYSALKTHFGVAKYDKIPRKDFEIALDIIRGWYPKRREAN